jgi:hypothetical protein
VCEAPLLFQARSPPEFLKFFCCFFGKKSLANCLPSFFCFLQIVDMRLLALPSLFLVLSLLALEEVQAAALWEGQPDCRSFEDEFEPNSGAIVFDPISRRAIVRAPLITVPLVLGGGDEKRSRELIELSSLQLCSTDPDGGVDSFLFSAGSCLNCSSSGRSLLTARILFPSGMRTLNLELYRVVFPFGRANLTSNASISLVDVGGNLTNDRQDQDDFVEVTAPLVLAPINDIDAGSLFMVRISDGRSGDADAAPYRLRLALVDPSVACSAAAAAAMTADTAEVRPVGASAREFHDGGGYSACALTHFDFGTSWTQGPGTTVVVGTMEAYPRIGSGQLSVAASLTGAPCCDLGQGEDLEAGYSLLKFSANTENVRWYAQVNPAVSPTPFTATFFAVQCDQADFVPSVTTYNATPGEWASSSVLSFPPVPLCSVSRLFHIDISSLDASAPAGEDLHITIERSNALMFGSPSLFARVVFANGSTTSDIAASESWSRKNTVVIRRSAIRSAGVSHVEVEARRAAVIDVPEVLMPPSAAVSVEFWTAVTPFKNCSANFTIYPGADSVNFTVCRGQPVTVTLAPHTVVAESEKYDSFSEIEIQQGPGTPPPEVLFRMSFQALQALDIMDTTDPIRQFGSHTIRSPYGFIDPFGLSVRTNIYFHFENQNDLPVNALLSYAGQKCRGDDGFVNSGLNFNADAKSLPLVPYDGGSGVVKPEVCSRIGDFFRVETHNATFLEATVSFSFGQVAIKKSGTGNATVYASEFAVVDLAWLDGRGVELTVDTTTSAVARWGRSLLLDLRQLSPYPDEVYIRATAQFAASIDVSLGVTWRRSWEADTGIRIRAGSDLTPVPLTTAIATGIALSTSDVKAKSDSSATSGISAGVVGLVVGLAVVFVLLCLVFALVVVVLRSRRSRASSQTEASIELPSRGSAFLHTKEIKYADLGFDQKIAEGGCVRVFKSLVLCCSLAC